MKFLAKIIVTLITLPFVGQTVLTLQVNDTSLSIAEPQTASLPQLLQVYRDEFNSTESTLEAQVVNMNNINNNFNESDYRNKWMTIRQILISTPLNNCCPSWRNLVSSQEVQEDFRRRFGKGRNSLKAKDLLAELQRTFINITFLSIDGQPGEIERDKYYTFYDNVQYYLRLVVVAKNYLNEQSETEEANFNVVLKRHLKSIENRVNQEPTLVSFISELATNLTESSKSSGTNGDFDLYEDFIKNTQFGQHYARNISFIRESVMVFNQICSHLADTKFPNNLTRPSKQYELVRRMSFEAHLIKMELMQQINPRVLNNREDVQRMFERLKDLTDKKPYIKLLGDEFSSSPPFFSSHVRQLTQLLDLYLSDSLTKVSFYNQLADLPEDFIILGASIAHDYEKYEVPKFSKFNPEYYGWPDFETIKEPSAPKVVNTTKPVVQSVAPRQEHVPFFSRLFS